MGSEAVWVPLVLAAVAGGVSYYNTRQTARKTDNALAQQINDRAKKQERADQRVSQLVDDIEASSPASQTEKLRSQYLSQLQAANPNTVSGLAAPSGASRRFQEDAAGAALGLADTGADLSDIASRVDAARRQREDEGRLSARAATDLGLIAREDRGDTFLGEIRRQSIRRNPWLDALSSALNAYGSTYTGGAAGGAASIGAGSFGGDASGVTDWAQLARMGATA